MLAVTSLYMLYIEGCQFVSISAWNFLSTMCIDLVTPRYIF